MYDFSATSGQLGIHFWLKMSRVMITSKPMSFLHDTHELQLIDAFKKQMPVYVRRTFAAANLKH